MGIDFGVIWAADFNNAIRLDVRRPARRPKVTRRLPSQQNSKKITDISLLVSIFGLFRSLISTIRLYFTPASQPPGKESPAAPPTGQRSPAVRRHNKIQRR